MVTIDEDPSVKLSFHVERGKHLDENDRVVLSMLDIIKEMGITARSAVMASTGATNTDTRARQPRTETHGNRRTTGQGQQTWDRRGNTQK